VVLTPGERETICRTDDVEGAWLVYTSQPDLMAKLKKDKYPLVRDFKYEGKVIAYEFRVPLDRVTIMSPVKTKAKVTHGLLSAD